MDEKKDYISKEDTLKLCDLMRVPPKDRDVEAICTLLMPLAKKVAAKFLSHSNSAVLDYDAFLSQNMETLLELAQKELTPDIFEAPRKVSAVFVNAMNNRSVDLIRKEFGRRNTRCFVSLDMFSGKEDPESQERWKDSIVGTTPPDTGTHDAEWIKAQANKALAGLLPYKRAAILRALNDENGVELLSDALRASGVKKESNEQILSVARSELRKTEHYRQIIRELRGDGGDISR